MPLYAQASASFDIATDDGYTDKLASRSLSFQDSEIFEEVVSHRLLVADGETDFAVSSGGIDNIKALYVKTDAEITLKLNGTHQVTVSKWFALPETSNLTSLTIANASGGAATVDVVMAGY